MSTQLDDWKRLDVFCRRYADLTDEQRLRWMIHKRNYNGLANSGAISKRAGRWFIHVPRFRDWLESGAGE